MAKASGGTRPKRDGGLKPRDFDYKGKVGRPQSLKTIQNKAVYDSVMDAISRYHSVLGVRDKEIKLASLPSGVGGVHFTRGGESAGIFLNKDIFQPAEATTQSVAAWAKAGYDSGHLTKTNRPVGGIILHELGHATWNEHMTGQKYVEAGKEIKLMYRNWVKDKSKENYGRYAATNISEFWAEASAKAVSGYRDKYVDGVKHIIRKYQL